MYLDLLKQELDCLEQLNHPNIVKVLELLEDTDNIYCVMELLETGNLLQMHKKIFNAYNSISTKEKIANNIIYQLMLAVNYMHVKGTIHRDIKMENLMVEIIEEHGK